MLQVRNSESRGKFALDWLKSAHTFSFGSYFDPEHMGFRSLRVINQDTVQPGAGFPPHGHRDMEILSLVTSGALEHRDSMQHGSIIRAGELQYMSAGRGVVHSEYNASDDEVVEFLQIWISPKQRGGTPKYDQRAWADLERTNRFRTLASGENEDGAVLIQQDARLSIAKLTSGARVDYELLPGRGAWLQVLSGNVTCNETALASGDGAAVEHEPKLVLSSNGEAELLLFDLGA